MPRMNRMRWILLLAGAMAAPAADYTFTKIAETGPDSPFALVAPCGISDSGVVLFTGVRKDGLGGIYLSSGGKMNKVLDDSGELLSAVPSGINSSGTISLYGILDDLSTGVFTFGGGKLTRITAATTQILTATPHINDGGQVSFVSGFPDSTPGVFVTRDGVVQQIAGPSGQFSGLQAFGGGQINAHGDVVFKATDLTGRQGGIFFGSSANSIRKLDLSNAISFTPGISGLGEVSINDDGAVAFAALVDRITLSILIHDGSKISTLVSTSIIGGASTFRVIGAPAIDNRGVVVFAGQIGEGANSTSGLYIGPDPVKDKVIATGDMLFGQRIAAAGQTSFIHRYVNARGQIVFSYSLPDGALGVAVATPSEGGGTGPVPGLPATGILNAASFQPMPALAPGAVVTLFGTNFAPKLATAPAPLPQVLEGLIVSINGVRAPLFFVSPNQINFQVPYELAAGAAEVRVETPQGRSEPRTTTVAPAVPAIYTLSGAGSGQGIVLFANTSTFVAAPGFNPIIPSRAARAGDILTIYANGLGAVTPSIASGSNSCENSRCTPDFSNLTLRRTVLRPTIEIGGSRVPDENVIFSGLSPEFVGLYSINVILPPGVPKGDAVPVVIRQGTAASQPNVTIAVE